MHFEAKIKDLYYSVTDLLCAPLCADPRVLVNINQYRLWEYLPNWQQMLWERLFCLQTKI